MNVQVRWRKAPGDLWYSFQWFNLTEAHEAGVYAIWHGGTNPRVIRIGQGIIADRLAQHRHDPNITKYAANGPLLVTWAALAAQYRDGVERYLAERYPPLEGARFPASVPIAVNGPWG